MTTYTGPMKTKDVPILPLGCRYHPNCAGHKVYFSDPSLTKQSFKDECDINQIIERARNGADVAHLNTRIARYGDVTKVPDYQSALNTVMVAENMFMELDARVRERFANDPARFLEFVQDPKNADEARSLGLLKPLPEPPPAPAPAAPPAGPETKSPKHPPKKGDE